MSSEKRQEVISAYYDKNEGLNYNLGRVHIHSCDFALGNYTYVEDNDAKLETFSIDHDRELIIPLIKDAFEKRGEPLKILASPWSPPAWMKSNGMMNKGGYLLKEHYDTWAKYYVKFIEEYEKENIPIWGLTVQNEPEAVQTWDSCIYTEFEERDFVKNHLGPLLHDKGYENKKLLIWDHNRDMIVRRAKGVLDDKDASKYVWGIGFHWYVSEDFHNLSKVHELFPDKHFLFTEGCQEGGVHLGSWDTGERYARNIIGDFNNWNRGFLDWNITLDETGGPNHVGNLCDAPIICDTVNDKVFKNSSYYYIGHFSKYVMEGAKRIFTNSDIENIKVVGFENPDNKIVLVVMNDGNEDKEIALKIDDRFININILNHSINTLIY